MPIWRPEPQSPADFPPEVRTVGAALAAGKRIEAVCHSCWGSRDVDLDRIVGFHGPDYSLIDRRPRCTFRSGCNGRVQFRFIGGHRLQALETEPCVRWHATKTGPT